MNWPSPETGYIDVPRGARKLDCRNCRAGDRYRHPELGLVYCVTCPVTRRRERKKAARTERLR